MPTNSNKEIKQVQQAFTEMRHLPGGQDIKIIAIFNFHYTMAVSKYLRQSNVHFYTTIGTSDKKNVLDIVGKNYIQKVHSFIKLKAECLAKSKFTIKLGNKGNKFIYPYQEPFAPVFFYNGNTARVVVYPLRIWISPNCTTCFGSNEADISQMAEMEEFASQAAKTNIVPKVLKQAARIKLHMAGIEVYDPNIRRAMRFIDKYSENSPLSLDALMKYFNLRSPRVTLKVDKKLLKSSKSDLEVSS